MRSERSLGSLLMAFLAIALIGASLVEPWFSYDYSSGRRAPEGGYHDPEVDGVIRHDFDAKPGSYSGDTEPEEQAAAQSTLDQISWALYAAIAILIVVALAELPVLVRLLSRRTTLLLSVLALAAVAVALWLMWYKFPGTVGHGVDGPFTSYLDEDGTSDDGYTMTTIRRGWVWAAFSCAAIFGGILFKFQAGAPDPSEVPDLTEGAA